MRRSGVRASPGARFSCVNRWNYKTFQERPREGHPHTSVISIVNCFRKYACGSCPGIFFAVTMVPLKHPPPDEGLEPATLRLKVWCSTDWANRAYDPRREDECLAANWIWIPDCIFRFYAKTMVIYAINEQQNVIWNEKWPNNADLCIFNFGTVWLLLIFVQRKPG